MSTAAVKIKVTIAQPFVVAGTPFSLTTTVENAHEETIDILEFLFHIPYQVQWIQDATYDEEFKKKQSMPWYRRVFCASPSKKAAQPPGQVMWYGNSKAPDQPVMSVLPSESSNYTFKALASKWLFISGGELVFPMRLKYRYKQSIHYATFEIRLTLRPPILSNGIGAISGAVLGSFARSLKEEGAMFFQNLGIEFAAASALAATLSIIAVVYSSRRTGESQPILTVEDFFGGLIVGFMMGYLGHEFFQKIVPIH